MALLAAPAYAAPLGAATLGIFGNANMDDTIDEDDIAYVEDIIEGTNEETELADANCDGKVDRDDITQIDLVIRREEKELTIVDDHGDAVTVKKPVTRVIPDHITSLEAIRVLGAADLIVATQALTDQVGPTFLQGLGELPTVGGYRLPDYEAILSLNPDIYFVYSGSQEQKAMIRENLPGITVIYAGYNEPYDPNDLTVDIRQLGYILDRRDQAEEYINWHNSYLDLIKERVAGLSEDEKPLVYVTCFSLYSCRAIFPPIDIAGGINIGADLGGGYCAEVDPEWVVIQNPDILIDPVVGWDYGYDVDDLSVLMAVHDDIMNHPELANVTAVEGGRIYHPDIYSIGLFPNNIISVAYYAKWLHPDLFEDLDPQRVHQEYLDRFTPIEFNVKEHGVFVYPPLED
ncbi:MAG: ABC transporter substrate-binding protein [Methanotrichaceae archaeon]|nr:ABC transporter substrate-binding protein [Methanotrichaceae archaeon]